VEEVRRRALRFRPHGRVHVVVEADRSRLLEPDVIETKYYVSGIGLVLAVSVAGEVEDAKLVSVTTGP
jgi:hypothetical protein